MIDKTILHSLFCQYYSEMKHLARTLLYTEEEAEDTVQDVFVRFVEASQKGASPKNAEAYLMTAVRNSCINRIRQKSLTEQVKNLYFLFNHWSEQYSKSPISIQNLVLSMYRKGLDNLLTAHLPDTRFMDRYTNLDEKCSVRSPYKGCARLASGVNDLINDIYDQKTIVEVF